MMFRTCSFEKEAFQALKNGHWPDGCLPELRAHVAACASCGDLMLVTQAFQNARNESVQPAAQGSPGFIWWRAQLRRRNAAELTISKPITVAQAFAWALTLIVFAVFVATQARQGLHWASQCLASASLYFSHPASTATKMDWSPFLLIPGFGLLLFVSGIVFYLASEKQ